MTAKNERPSDPRPTRRRPLLRAFIGLVTTLAGGLTLVALGTTTARAGTTADACPPLGETTDWRTATARANDALARALDDVAAGQYDEARRDLRQVKRNLRKANNAAAALIGQPPTDPESDEPPGPTAVLRVVRLDHRITMVLVPLLVDPAAQQVGGAIGTGLDRAASCRASVLTQVIAQRPAARDDYTDGLADTLPDYGAELTTIAGALSTDELTSEGRAALEQTQQLVTVTQTAMEGAFGGGERPVLHR